MFKCIKSERELNTSFNNGYMYHLEKGRTKDDLKVSTHFIKQQSVTDVLIAVEFINGIILLK